MPETSSPAASARPVSRRLLAETVGTGLLVTVVVGSGIAAQQLSPGDVGLQLLENSTATVFGLAVLILIFGPVSGAHFNPVVSAADWFLGRRTGTRPAAGTSAAYTAAQIVGAVAGRRPGQRDVRARHRSRSRPRDRASSVTCIGGGRRHRRAGRC